MPAKKRVAATFPEFVSHGELAEIAGVSESLIQQFRSNGLFGQMEPGQYPFLRCLKALFAYWREQAAGLPQQRAADQARQARADADTAEVRAGREIGALMFRKDAKLLWAAAVIEARRAVAASKASAAVKKEISEKLLKIKIGEHSEPA